MRRFVALSLSFFILVNCFDIKSSASFVNIKPTMSLDSDDIVRVSYIKPTQQDMPYFDASMSSFCIGLIKFELKNPQKFMPNVKVNIKVSPPPSVSRIAWNKFKNAIWPISHAFITLGSAGAGAAAGAALGSWKYNVDIVKGIVKGDPKLVALSGGGIFWGLGIRFLISDSGCSANDFKMSVNSIPFEYSLDPISEQEAKTLQAFPVRAGEKKKDLKDYENLRNNIDKINGRTKVEQLADELVNRPIRTLINPNIDSGDPFNAVETGNIIKYDNYRAPINIENYVSFEEAKLTNLQNAMKKSQFCKNHSDDQEGINVSNYSSKILVTLSRDNPVQYAAIMVNNSVEAAKLRKLLERSCSATSQLVYRLKNSFSTKLVLSLPDGSTADEDTEREAEIALGSGPSWPARIVSLFVPHGVAGYASSLVDWAWKGIYDNVAWVADRIKGKFFIETDPIGVATDDEYNNPHNSPSLRAPQTQQAQQNAQTQQGAQQQGGQRPQDQQNQNNQQQPGMDPGWALPVTDQHYMNNPNWVIPQENSPANDVTDNSSIPWVVMQGPNANDQAQQHGNQPPQQGGQQQQQNNQAPAGSQQQNAQTQTTADQAVDATENDRFKGIGRTVKGTNTSGDRPANNNNDNCDYLDASENDKPEINSDDK